VIETVCVAVVDEDLDGEVVEVVEIVFDVVGATEMDAELELEGVKDTLEQPNDMMKLPNDSA
jgi:hypothetical protein